MTDWRTMLRRLEELRRQLDEEEADAVGRALEQGASWDEVTDELARYGRRS